MQDKSYYVYILAKERNGTFYVGVTSDLVKRIYEHKNKRVDGFTKKYGIDQLVYYEMHADVNEVSVVRKVSNDGRDRKRWRPLRA